MTEQGTVRYGNTTIAYSVVRSVRRKKTVQITLDPLGGVMVATPEALAGDEIRRIVERRAGWIVQRASDASIAPAPKQFVSGESLPYLGREVRMDVSQADVPRVRIRFAHWGFFVSAPASLAGEERREAIYAAFMRWYRRRALDRVRDAVARWSSLLRVQPAGVAIRNQRQRWGSCAPDGTLRFNWRVVLAEATLIDYVVVHELLHLAIRPHSREYWESFSRAMPDYASRRARLREVGARLAF